LRKSNVEAKGERREKSRRKNLYLCLVKEKLQQATPRVQPLSKTKTKGKRSDLI